MQSLESGLQYLDRLPKEQNRGRQASQHVEGVERAQRRHVVNFVVGEAVEGAVEDVPAVGGVEGGEGGNGQGEEGEEEDVDEEERPDEAVLDLEE